MVLIALGVILLTQNLSYEHIVADLWRALAVALGISIIFPPLNRNRNNKKKFKMWFVGHRGQHGPSQFRTQTSSGGGSSHDAHEFFSGSERVVDGEYTGSLARVKLAGGSIDLTNATLPEEGAVLELDIVLGGYKVRVPNTWKVDINADINMGEISDNREDHGGDAQAGPKSPSVAGYSWAELSFLTNSAPSFMIANLNNRQPTVDNKVGTCSVRSIVTS